LINTEPELQSILERADLSQAYEARQIEGDLYRWWETSGYFTPQIDPNRKPFVISMPPPNVTGRLHTGHAMTMTIEDIMVRWHRMLGDPTLWVPGTDHAGIATQNVVEKELTKEGLTRHDLGRDAFVQRVWAWKEQYGSTITYQIRRMGASCDWTYERFTLDPGLSHAVRTAFVKLFNEGLIYRGTYLVNWCPRCRTAISDLEVNHEQEQGSLWYIRYYVADESQDWRGGDDPDRAHITVATTRPETLLGDVAVAVHPDDERYADLVGKEVLLPALGRRIPVIADESVEREFGTGAVKITPAHDPNDYDMGQRHGLPQINVMNLDATINAEGGPYAGLDRYAARAQLVNDLQASGNLERTEKHALSIGRCERCDTVVEPLLSTQWFVRMQPLAKPAIAAVRAGRTRIIPERFEKVYFHWLENIHDWCISRQLWWGHRVPVWYCNNCNGMTVAVEDPDRCSHCDSTAIKQDDDVLDTWFSSGLWPFSTLGWPKDTEDLRYFYPTTVMETGYDILFFWVARMMMLGIHFTGKEPFQTIYLHGLVRDEFNRKMSKSLGNTVDPLDLIEQYGTDAVRFTFATSSTPGQDFALQPLRLEAARNFANKLWNATRFVLSKLEGSGDGAGAEAGINVTMDAATLADRWIVSRYNSLVGDVDRLMKAYNFGEAGRQIQSFFWDDFADWYIETAKVQLNGDAEQQQHTRAVLRGVLEGLLRLLHPFMPFVTEVAWQHLQRQTQAGRNGNEIDSIMLAAYPHADTASIDQEAERDWELVQEIVRGIRNVRNESNVEPGRWIEAIIVGGDKAGMLGTQRSIISRLARVAEDKLEVLEHLAQKPQQTATVVAGTVEAYLPLAGMVDLQEERQRLRKDLERAEADIQRRASKLTNENFVNRAPTAVVQRERDALAEAEATAARLRERINSLG
jgi:valyl-tRNA synthetase